MKTLDDARELATEMVEIGKMAGRKTVAVITDMDEPLGHAVGNALEVKEAIAALRGEYKSELLELCLTLGSCILMQAGMAADDAAARAMLEQTITDGSALKKLAEFVAAQDGDPAAIYDPSRLPCAGADGGAVPGERLCAPHRGDGRGPRVHAPRRRPCDERQRDRPQRRHCPAHGLAFGFMRGLSHLRLFHVPLPFFLFARRPLSDVGGAGGCL